ncbi:MAG: hypothetical protein ACUVXF_07890 [Desulfobaccales bacterium]
MSKQFIRGAVILCLGLSAVAAAAGTWSDNQFFYKPSLGARGPAEQSSFETGLTRVDAHLGRYKTLGDPNYSTLTEALATIGGNALTLTIPAGTVAVTANTTVGSNIALKVLKGGMFSVSNGVTLTINGPIEAGPYQIFAGAGTVTLGGVSTIYDVWFASPPATPEGNVAAPVGARFIKTGGSAPLVYVKESGSGTSGWAALSTLPGGSEPTTFLGLTDTPSSYSGQAGKTLRVNSGATALEFGNPDHAHANQTYLDAINQHLATASSPTFAGTTINGNITVTGTVDGVDVSNHKSRHEAGGADALAHQNLAGAGAYTHAQIDAHLTDTNNPHSVTAAQVGAIANAADTVKDTHI